MLGWKILKKGDYKLKLPILTAEEESIITEVEKRYREISRIEDINKSEDAKRLIKEILIMVLQDEGFEADKEQIEYITDMAFRHIYGLYFLDDLLKDENVEEIAVIGLNKPVYVYLTGEGWKKVNVTITSENALIELINKTARGLGRRITLQNPRLDASLPDGSRLHASIPPISKGEMTIRKFKENPLSPKHIIGFNTGTIEMFALLSLFMQSDTSIMIAGNTASGKTTTLNALSLFTPKKERILITEETPEINIPHEHQIRIVANKEMGITLSDLVYDSLRMRPDRIIVGEVRNKEETQALVDVLLGGQARGAYTTFHAQSAQEALSRMHSFGVQKEDLDSIDLILVQRRMLRYDRKKRKNIEVRKIVEISMVKNSAPNILFKYDSIKDLWKTQNLEKAFSFLGDLLGLKKKEIKEEFEERKKLIKKAPTEFKSFFSFIQNSFYGAKHESNKNNK